MHLSSFPRRIALLAATAALIVPLFSTSAALADSDDNANSAVARLSVINGSVAVQRGDTTSPSAAAINAPILAGDYITTGDDSRAEVEVTGGTAVRLGQNVQLRFTHLNTDARALQLAEGTIELRLMRGTDGSSTIDTPSISVRPRGNGSYRVTVTPEGQTVVTVRRGDAEIIAPQGNQSLTPGTTLVAEGPASGPSITTQEAIALDSFDGFNQQRDGRYEQAQAHTADVDQDVTGVQDLDAYGHWVSDPTYGQVWAPTAVAADWAPYRDGRWVWEDGFGWTWVATEPWGWAPYHYGSWFHSPSYGWAWCPPRPAPFVPVWRPALVAFFSFGGGGGSSFGVGYAGGGFGLSVGWVPLAPFETYHPWWHNGWGGGNNVTINNTIINNTTIINNYRNAQYGVTSVSGERFTQGDFRHPVVVAPGQLRNVAVVRGAVPVVPTTANLRYSETHVAPQLAVRPAFAQHTFAGFAAPVRRTPFEEQRTAISTVTHIPLAPTTTTAHGNGAATLDRPVTGAMRAPTETGTMRAPTETSNMHSTGSPSIDRVTTGSVRVPSETSPARNDAWSRFGANRGIATAPHAPVSTPATGSSGRYSGGETTRAGYAAPSATTRNNGYAPYQPPATTTRSNAYGAPATTTRSDRYAPYQPPSTTTRGNAYGAPYQPPSATTRSDRYAPYQPPSTTTRGNAYGSPYQPPSTTTRNNGFGDAPVRQPPTARSSYGQYQPTQGSAPARTFSAPRTPAREAGPPGRGYSAPAPPVRAQRAPRTDKTDTADRHPG